MITKEFLCLLLICLLALFLYKIGSIYKWVKNCKNPFKKKPIPVISEPDLPQSRPICITVENLTGDTLNDVSLFDIVGKLRDMSKFDEKGDYISKADNQTDSPLYKISSGIPGVSFYDICCEFFSLEAVIQIIYLQSHTANQIFSPLTYNNRNIFGDRLVAPFKPSIDPYQFQSNILQINKEIKINKFSDLVIKELYSNATVTIKLFPSTISCKTLNFKTLNYGIDRTKI